MNIFEDFDFSILDSPDFKEDTVREEIILPILKRLGYAASGTNKIIRSKNVSHPFVKVGSKKVPLTYIPDYLFEVENKYAWVLDAKAPNEEIKSGGHVEQTYFYSIHPEIRTDLFALCNAREFIDFNKHSEMVLHFHVSEINLHWEKLTALLSPSAFKRQNLHI